MFAFIKKIIHYDYLHCNRLKKNLSKYDLSLIEFLKLIGVNIDHLNFFDKSFKLSVNKYIRSTDPFLIFRKKSITRNHDRIAIQFLIKIMQTNKCIIDYEYRRNLIRIFKLVAVYYSDREYEQICVQYIKDDWRDSFCFYNIMEPDFEIRFYKYYYDYNQNYFDYNQNYYNTFNNYYNKHKNQTKTINLLKVHFDKLGIEITKDMSIIKSQYRKLCLVHHPDKGGDKNMFISITESYNYILQHIND